MADKSRHIEKIKRIAIKANKEGDSITLFSCIEWLDEIWHDHEAAMRFFTSLEQNAPTKWKR